MPSLCSVFVFFCRPFTLHQSPVVSVPLTSSSNAVHPFKPVLSPSSPLLLCTLSVSQTLCIVFALSLPLLFPPRRRSDRSSGHSAKKRTRDSCGWTGHWLSPPGGRERYLGKKGQ
uniref:Secreted protein n=1 Tax=Globodera rostochiensis TaxID=31243 RepID=A0A914GVH2_GLORO